MLLSSVNLHRNCAVGLFMLAALPVAAQTPDSAATPTVALPTRPQGTLVKLGTGLTRGIGYGGYSGLSVPLVLGVEHHLTPHISLYANAFSGFNFSRPYRYIDNSRNSIVNEFGFDAGIRYYYNQEKRRQKGRATGPFIGNYLALQTSTVFSRTPYQHVYDYSTLTLAWGMQRRLGKYGWLDAYAGLGIGRNQQYFYNPDGRTLTPAGSRLGLAPEIGVKFSLGSRLTH